MSSSNAAIEPAPTVARGRSITGRLVFLYGVSASITLFLASTVLYWATLNGLRRDGEQFLTEKVHVLRAMLRQRPDDQALLEEEVQWEAGLIGHARYLVQIARPDGAVLTQTRGFRAARLEQQDFPAPIPLAQSEPVTGDFETADGRHYLLAAAVAQLGPDPAARRIVRLAVDVTNDDRILADFRRIAIGVLLAGLGLSTALGVWAARRGLRPLREVTQAIRNVSAARLSTHLAPGEWPSELRELVTAFNQLLQRLEQAFGRISSLAGELAHELRTPVNNLMGEAEVVLGQPRSADEYRQTIESSLEEYERLSHMIDTLLFLARAENPNAHLQRSTFSVRSELAAIAEYLEPLAQEKNLELDCEGDAELWADRPLVRRALTNVLANAFRYTPAGGRVSVRVASGADRAVTLSVTDNGPGIDVAEQAKVFERFYRGASSQGDGQGAGLGLAIVRSILQLHGGWAELASEPGRGTTVTLSFPGGAAPQAAGS